MTLTLSIYASFDMRVHRTWDDRPTNKQKKKKKLTKFTFLLKILFNFYNLLLDAMEMYRPTTTTHFRTLCSFTQYWPYTIYNSYMLDYKWGSLYWILNVFFLSLSSLALGTNLFISYSINVKPKKCVESVVHWLVCIALRYHLKLIWMLSIHASHAFI